MGATRKNALATAEDAYKRLDESTKAPGLSLVFVWALVSVRVSQEIWIVRTKRFHESSVVIHGKHWIHEGQKHRESKTKFFCEGEKTNGFIQNKTESATVVCLECVSGFPRGGVRVLAVTPDSMIEIQEFPVLVTEMKTEKQRDGGQNRGPEGDGATLQGSAGPRLRDVTRPIDRQEAFRKRQSRNDRRSHARRRLGSARDRWLSPHPTGPNSHFRVASESAVLQTRRICLMGTRRIDPLLLKSWSPTVDGGDAPAHARTGFLPTGIAYYALLLFRRARVWPPSSCGAGLKLSFSTDANLDSVSRVAWDHRSQRTRISDFDEGRYLQSIGPPHNIGQKYICGKAQLRATIVLIAGSLDADADFPVQLRGWAIGCWVSVAYFIGVL
ncbi:hypothetical protein B0H11DRAFT_2375328 [Mycena galericulata]|nr:hypothetical protein B0H11DRAFT_2375328 [Mycena galericulata]